MNDIRLDLTILDNMFDKWMAEDDSLSNDLNPKFIKQMNVDLRLKIESWVNRKAERKNIKKRWFEHGKALRK